MVSSSWSMPSSTHAYGFTWIATKFLRCLTGARLVWGWARARRSIACVRNAAQPLANWKNALRPKKSVFMEPPPCDYPSKMKLQGELKDARIERARQPPKISRRQGGAGVVEVGVIQDVEEFGPHLEVPVLVDAEMPCEANIDVEEPRTEDRAAPGTSKRADGIL